MSYASVSVIISRFTSRGDKHDAAVSTWTTLISDGEAEQGLGTVLTCDGRLLTILYPATGETRQYSQRNAPLTRVRFVPGDEISHFEGWTLTVREVSEVDGLLIYQGFNSQNEDCVLPETQLSTLFNFVWPVIV